MGVLATYRGVIGNQWQTGIRPKYKIPGPSFGVGIPNHSPDPTFPSTHGSKNVTQKVQVQFWIFKRTRVSECVLFTRKCKNCISSLLRFMSGNEKASKKTGYS
jgi:hypothetical protein